MKWLIDATFNAGDEIWQNGGLKETFKAPSLRVVQSSKPGKLGCYGQG
jgi:hypothetical protein